MFLPGQQAPAGHLPGQGTSVQFGQMVLHADSFGKTAGGSQNPMAAKHMHALFSAGQQSGHSFPGVSAK
jgi:hypothetical protein